MKTLLGTPYAKRFFLKQNQHEKHRTNHKCRHFIKFHH